MSKRLFTRRPPKAPPALCMAVDGRKGSSRLLKTLMTRSGKLTVDENALLWNTQGRDGAIGDIPREEEIRIFTPNGWHCCN
uniref:Uncharacterized protein n=1 Tax=Cucumis melo TaxID=3656 RepID=A0A9I9EMC0_CUCME